MFAVGRLAVFFELCRDRPESSSQRALVQCLQPLGHRQAPEPQPEKIHRRILQAFQIATAQSALTSTRHPVQRGHALAQALVQFPQRVVGRAPPDLVDQMGAGLCPALGAFGPIDLVAKTGRIGHEHRGDAEGGGKTQDRNGRNAETVGKRQEGTRGEGAQESIQARLAREHLLHIGDRLRTLLTFPDGTHDYTDTRTCPLPPAAWSLPRIRSSNLTASPERCQADERGRGSLI